MEKKHHHMIGWIAAAALSGGVLWYYLSRNHAPKPPAGLPPGAGGSPAAGGGISGAAGGGGAGVPSGPATGPAGTNVYTKPATMAVIRSSPEIDSGSILGELGSLFTPSLPDLSTGNFLASLNTPGLFLGTIVGQFADGNGATDPNGNVYTWYQLQASTYVSSQAGGSGPYYVRADQVQVK